MKHDDDDQLIAEMRYIISEAKKYRERYGARYDDAVDFTLEMERGETYRSEEIALYGHRAYEPGSVLEGQNCRHYIGRPSPGFIDRLPDDLKKATEAIRGSTHRAVREVVAHLPDEDGMTGPQGLDDLPDLGWEDRHGSP